jgi:ribonuclease BN (tRNA processing enzyme)
MYIKFLGTCGGRFATIFQTRSTGGIYLKEEETRISLDPGPGALVRFHQEKIDPTLLNAVVVSHCPIDNANDAAILAETITKGSTRRNGVLIASPSVVNGYGGSAPIIPRYYLTKLDRVISVKAGDSCTVGNINITATPAQHTDRTTVGYIFNGKNGKIGYVSDSSYFPEMIEIYRDCRLLIICTTRPLNARIHHHICTEDAAELVAGVTPETAVLTHFGLKTLHEGTKKQARWIFDRTGIRTIAACDSMVIETKYGIHVDR